LRDDRAGMLSFDGTVRNGNNPSKDKEGFRRDVRGSFGRDPVKVVRKT
jgi:hypothetical protein